MLVQAARSSVTLRDVYDAIAARTPNVACAEIITAHTALESGWFVEAWNWDLWNHKATAGDIAGGADYCERACGENVDRDTGLALIAAHPENVRIEREYQATRKRADGSEYVQAMLALSLSPIVQGWTEFRAFPSLVAALEHHLTSLHGAYADAYARAIAGDVDGYVAALKARFYFTAELAPYQRAVRECLPMVRERLASSAPAPAALARLLDIFTPLPGESLENWVARSLVLLDGAHPERDGILFYLARATEGAAAAQEQYRTTNCATSMRWIWKWLGVKHRFVGMPDAQIRQLRPGGPVAWCLEIASDLGALIDVRGKTPEELEEIIGEGWGVHYDIPGVVNSDHMEWCTDRDLADDTPDEHFGGGRAGNRLTREVGDIVGRTGRKPHHVININRMVPDFVIAPRPDLVAYREELERLNAVAALVRPSPLEERETLEPPT